MPRLIPDDDGDAAFFSGLSPCHPQVELLDCYMHWILAQTSRHWDPRILHVVDYSWYAEAVPTERQQESEASVAAEYEWSAFSLCR